jgi:hypothetical protein
MRPLSLYTTFTEFSMGPPQYMYLAIVRQLFFLALGTRQAKPSPLLLVFEAIPNFLPPPPPPLPLPLPLLQYLSLCYLRLSIATLMLPLPQLKHTRKEYRHALSRYACSIE